MGIHEEHMAICMRINMPFLSTFLVYGSVYWTLCESSVHLVFRKKCRLLEIYGGWCSLLSYIQSLDMVMRVLSREVAIYMGTLSGRGGIWATDIPSSTYRCAFLLISNLVLDLRFLRTGKYLIVWFLWCFVGNAGVWCYLLCAGVELDTQSPTVLSRGLVGLAVFVE